MTDMLQRSSNEKFMPVITTDLKGTIAKFQYENPSTKKCSNRRCIGIFPHSVEMKVPF